MRLEFTATDQLSETQREGIKQLRTVLYSDTMLARTLIGKQIVWAAPQWSILVWEEDELIARVGLILREIISNGGKKQIGGIGSVMAHPEQQKNKGHASTAMREAIRMLDEEYKVAFALLFSGSRKLEFYKRLQWKPFQGSTFVTQPKKGSIEFKISTVMVLDLKEPAPLQGTLDLNGLPW